VTLYSDKKIFSFGDLVPIKHYDLLFKKYRKRTLLSESQKRSFFEF
jgi:hypothetical protein